MIGNKTVGGCGWSSQEIATLTSQGRGESCGSRGERGRTGKGKRGEAYRVSEARGPRRACLGEELEHVEQGRVMREDDEHVWARIERPERVGDGAFRNRILYLVLERGWQDGVRNGVSDDGRQDGRSSPQWCAPSPATSTNFSDELAAFERLMEGFGVRPTGMPGVGHEWLPTPVVVAG